MMNFWKKTIALCVLCMLCLFTLTGCKSEDNSIENLAYVVALGIDKGDLLSRGLGDVYKRQVQWSQCSRF